jgi:hypothetical protein
MKEKKNATKIAQKLALKLTLKPSLKAQLKLSWSSQAIEALRIMNDNAIQ